ncbi:Zinc finger, CCCH-type [Corchorus olitorius]|uniref:Zinc finger, CCCH-type n=1 Tax=Corchorus olitorius TaxID=93759 RepID=A0A1R3HRD5_9ROSI|nr:Zinc finger, CCCH-type [Corchorus olitorius]
MNLRSSETMESGPYPERPGEPDCSYYIRTGLCRFGATCRFNHPPNRKLAIAAARMKGEFPERVGQPECQAFALQYYLKTGTCKFGATCKFHHPRDKAGIAGRVSLNILGYPLRPNEAECAYYLRTGQCKFGSTCKFHHPQPTNMMVSLRGSPIYQTVPSPTTPGQQSYPGGITNWSRGTFIPSPRWQGPSSYAPLILPQGMVSVPGWNAYSLRQLERVVVANILCLKDIMLVSWIKRPLFLGLDKMHLEQAKMKTLLLAADFLGQVQFSRYLGQLASVSSSENLQQANGNNQIYGTSRQNEPATAGSQASFSQLRSGSVPVGFYALQRENVFPERPGQPECQFYMKTGDCKFGAVCRFHHPRERVLPAPDCMLSPIGLPLRPGEPLCIFYSRYGICKFGPSCKFNHPMGVFSYNYSTSSASDAPARRFLGSSSGTTGLNLSSEGLVEAGSTKPRRLSLSENRQLSSSDDNIDTEG